METATLTLPLIREEWLARRRETITATDVAKIVGVSPWGGPLDVYLDKKGLAEIAETPAMRLGKRLQPVVLDLYEQDTGTHLRRYGDTELVVCPNLSWAAATPDAEIAQTLRPVEAKTAGARQMSRWGEAGTDDVPEEYLIQVQWQMLVTGAQAADLAVLLAGQDFRIYPIRRHETLIAALVDQCDRFRRDHLAAEVMPALDGSASAREYLRRAFPRDTRPELLASDERLDVLACRLRDLRQARDNYGAEVETVENLIKADIGEAAGIQGANWRATWKATKASTVTDYAAMVREMAVLIDPAEYAPIHERNTTTKPGSRRFLFKFNETT